MEDSDYKDISLGKIMIQGLCVDCKKSTIFIHENNS